jgi:hypothetical protein
MAIVGALALVFVVAAAVTMGAQVGHDSAFMFRLVALPVLALVVFGAIYLWHRRKSAELIVARYHLKGDALGWRRVNLTLQAQVRVCAECGAIVPDFRAQEEHASWHEDLATLLAGKPLERDPEQIPWSAITEDAGGAEPEPAELPEAAQPAELPEAAQPAELPEVHDVDGWERKARGFRRSMEQLIRTGGRDDDDSGHDA